MPPRAPREEEVLRCLRYLREERGLRPGTRHGPRTFGWFKIVVADYFHRTVPGNRLAPPAWTERRWIDLSQQKFDSMTEAIEIEGV